MDDSKSSKSDVSNRVLLAALMIVVVAPLLLLVMENVVDGEVPPMPQIVIGVAVLLAVVADRIFLYLKSRQKKNEQTS